MKVSKKVLIADEMHESILSLLKSRGYDPVYLPVINRDGIMEVIKDFHGFIMRSKTIVDKELLNGAVNLKFVARAGAGMDMVDDEYLMSKGIICINAPEGNRDALGEHALGALLALLHRIPVSYEQVRMGIWDREGNRGIELKGKVVGIYGVGYMGLSFAKKLYGMDCEVIGYDKFKHNLSNSFIRQVSLDELRDRIDILSIHVPFNATTWQLFDRSYLETFTHLKVLVNTARGGVLNTGDLVGMLEDGSLYGAALDVLENEKLHTYSDKEMAIFKRLTSLPNVVITPHVGGWAFESYARINEVIMEKLRMAFGD